MLKYINFIIIFILYNNNNLKNIIMKHLKTFDTENAFEAEKPIISKPWVTLTEDDKVVHYMDIEYVNLHLPSGTLWCKCNLGANQEHEFGKYYQWGALEGYEDASHSTWQTCPFNNGSSNYDKEYFMSHLTDITNENLTLLSKNDAVHFTLGGGWSMPTIEDITELVNNTKKTWAIINGVRGIKFTDLTDSTKYIFIPCSGYANGGVVDHSNNSFGLWTSDLYITEEQPNGDNAVLFTGYYGSGYSLGGELRYGGEAIRPVYKIKK